jgi:hypothetical protein
MLGNMGYSTVNCVSMPIEVGSYTFTCPYGNIGEITDYGVTNPGSGNPADQCVNNANNEACKPDGLGIDTAILGMVGQPT